MHMKQHPHPSLNTARVFSAVIDFTLWWLVQFIGAHGGAFLAVFLVAGQIHSFDPMSEVVLTNASSVGMFLGSTFWGSVTWLMNHGILQGLTGSTIGKRLMGL